MSAPVSITSYRRALSTPGAVVPAFFSALGRFPIAMYSLATLLYVQATTGSFAAGGVVSAGMLVGVALGSVAQGRVIDRLGPTRPLLVVAVLLVAVVVTLVAAVEADVPLPVVVGLAVLAGLVQPALPGASRSLWSVLVPAGPRREAAYSYEAISLEVFFILGPAAAAFLVAAPWPGTALIVATAASAVGATGFALTRAVRSYRPAPVSGSRLGPLGALVPPGMLTVALAALGFGLVIGSVEVGVPAVAAAHGSPALGGVLLSVWSVASVLAGILYSLRPWPRPLHLRIPVLLGGFAVFVAAMAAAWPLGSLPLLVVVMLAAGALITPQATAHSLGVELAAPPGAGTEAFGWITTAVTLGAAAGQSGGGMVIESGGPASAFLAGGLAGAVLAVVLWLRRGTLVAAPQPALAPAV